MVTSRLQSKMNGQGLENGAIALNSIGLVQNEKAMVEEMLEFTRTIKHAANGWHWSHCLVKH